MSDESEGLTNDISNYKRLDDDDIENSSTKPVKGLTVLTCAMFIIAEIAGTGILALPRAVSDAGWTGVALLIICGLLAMYCGAILGNCWMMVREKNVKYRGSHVRDPYPIIGFETFGKPGRILVEVCVLTTLLGGCVVLLLLASKQISSLVDTKIGSFTSTNEFRLWVLICGLLLIPCTWFATPKDIWPFALGASFCTLVACICICVRSGIYISRHGILKTSEQSHSSTASIFKAFGTIAFSFGGASAFPTFQADMKQPSKFKYSAVIAFFGVLLMYLSVSILPYLAFGSNVQDDVLRTLKSLKGSGDALVPVAESFITVHLLFTFIIILNPISQQMEVYLKIPHQFGWRRLGLRTAIVACIIGLAETFPNFSPILSLIGGSTITMMAFILPCVFYIKLKSFVALHIKVAHAEIIFVSLVFGSAAIYFAAKNLENPFKS